MRIDSKIKIRLPRPAILPLLGKPVFVKLGTYRKELEYRITSRFWEENQVMKEVIQEAAKLSKEGEPCVLATVVRTKGSTPQKAGAMLFGAPGWFGCRHLGRGLRRGRTSGSLRRKSSDSTAAPNSRTISSMKTSPPATAWSAAAPCTSSWSRSGNPRTSRTSATSWMEAYEGGQAVGLATVVNVREGGDNLGAQVAAAIGWLGYGHPGKCRS